MKADFYGTGVDAYPRKPFAPAEACSDIGWTAEHQRRAMWVARWLEVTRRWFAQSRDN